MVKFKNGLLATLAPTEGCPFNWGRNATVTMPERRIEEDGWVVVKKQRVTILIPPAPSIYHQIQSRRAEQAQGKPKKTKKRPHTSSKRRFRNVEDGKRPSGTQNNKDRPCLLHPSTCILTASSNKAAEVTIHNVGSPTLEGPSHSHIHNVRQNAVSNGNHHVRVSRTEGDGPRPLIGALQVVNQRIKASNLERRLARLGGLKRWLASSGLGQFIHMLERERFDKFQLVNLTMGKLKDLGADAVGPRRKLLHAIDSLCQPYYLKAM